MPRWSAQPPSRSARAGAGLRIPRSAQRAGALFLVFAACLPGRAGQDPGRTATDPYPIPLAPRIPEGGEVATSPSGLRTTVLQPGLAAQAGGRTPREGDCVTLHFHAWTEDGRLHDSSVLRGDPVKTWVGKSIAGVDEALRSMTRGARWKLELPANLCSGPEGALPSLPAGRAMVLEIVVLDILFAPKFHPPRPEATLATPGGLKYEILRPGAGGEPPDQDKVLVLDYGLWTTSGTLLDCAARQGAMYEVKAAQLELNFDLQFMKEAFSLLRPGARLRFEVPPEQCFGGKENPGLPANSVTVWEFELVRMIEPRELPAFAPPDPAKLQRTTDGLEYEVVRPGTGPRPRSDGKVSAHYAIWLVNGRVVDASYHHGEPARLDLSDPGMLPGIREALLLMSEGGVLRCRLIPDLAYGARGWPPHVGPNAALILYLELTSAG